MVATRVLVGAVVELATGCGKKDPVADDLRRLERSGMTALMAKANREFNQLRDWQLGADPSADQEWLTTMRSAKASLDEVQTKLDAFPARSDQVKNALAPMKAALVTYREQAAGAIAAIEKNDGAAFGTALDGFEKAALALRETAVALVELEASSNRK